ncbi:MAG: helix-turn-helix domain-containing protein [Solobacterium sp.]|nr:helix-turn-helix domain-containing protein [Solobacterium sp.]
MYIRLEESCRLLRTSDYSIEEISSLIGFKDKSYFNRKFKEQYQLTPAKWRKSQTKK